MVTGHFTTPPPEGIIYAPMDIAVGVGEGLAKKGHRVDFYGPEGTKVNVTNVISAGLRPLKQNGDDSILKDPSVGGGEVNKIFNLWDQYLLARMFEKAERGDYDILHVHPVDRALPLALSHPKFPSFTPFMTRFIRGGRKFFGCFKVRISIMFPSATPSENRLPI